MDDLLPIVLGFLASLSLVLTDATVIIEAGAVKETRPANAKELQSA